MALNVFNISWLAKQRFDPPFTITHHLNNSYRRIA